MERTKVTFEAIRDWIAATVIGKNTARFELKQNKRKRMPARSFVVSLSPWGNYCVRGYINDNLMWCENGISLDSAARTVWCAARGE